jgi:predicted SAM-dependent methyltransferase
MKLNLGCGGDYKEGYINVDAFDKTVADKIMHAYDLKFKDNIFDEISIIQLIEHLGIVGSIHCLSECFRVLKPGKKIIIETPDLRKAFEKYLKGDREARKNILPWIYGVDIPGMVHRFCFPDDLIEEILNSIGFEKIKKEYIEIDSYEPILKITCKKPFKCEFFQKISIFRKRLFENKTTVIDNQILSLEKLDLVDYLSEKTYNYFKTKNVDEFRETLIYSTIKSPVITKIFLEVINSNEILPKKFCEKYLSLLDILIDLDFPNILMNTMINTPDFIGRQDELYSTITGMGKKSIEKSLNEEDRTEVINKLRQNSKNISHENKIDFFSKKIIMLKSNRFFQIGVKKFILGNYKESINMFNKSICFHGGQYLSYWNLARLNRIKNNKKDANTNYKNVSDLIDSLKITNIGNVKSFLKKEISDEKIDKYSSPITSLYDF